MKKYLALSFYLVSILSIKEVYSQAMPKIYYIRNDVKVLVGSEAKKSAWCGGVNNPQFSLADLNNDGKKDLVIYEAGKSIKTFINKGINGNPNYQYDGNYEFNFPNDLRGYARLLDYNQDKIPDLFQEGGIGYRVYRGYYNSNNQLCFTFYQDLHYYKNAGWRNAYVDPYDLPAIVDIDKDGDLDFLSYALSDRVDFYKNCQVEDGLPPDSIKICYADECWGKYAPDIGRAATLRQSCNWGNTSCKGCPPVSGNKTTDRGHTLCLLDYDGDGDFDALAGDIAYSDIQLLINGKNNTGSLVDTMISQDTSWSAQGHKMVIDKFPAAFSIDIDQDSDEDLLFAPHAQSFENYKCISYYKNTGSTKTPSYTFQSDTYLVDDMIDVGSHARPVFYDYNKDGKPDLFVSSEGYYQPGGSMKRMISYYENISDPNSPTYKLVTTDFMNLGSANLKGYGLSFGDLDNDGLEDMVMGQDNGTVVYYKNTASSDTVQPVWATSSGITVKHGSNKTIDVGGFASPLVYDLDTDGRADLVIGSESGHLSYYRGIGVTGTAAFDSVTNKLGGVKITEPKISGSHAVPFIGAIDDSKKEYLLIGSVYGKLYVYDFEKGNTTGIYNMLDTSYQGFKPGPRSAPAATDVDGDGKYELVVGNELGGLTLYRQLFNVGVKGNTDRLAQVKVYPNPANDVLNLSWSAEFADVVSINLITATGQKVLTHAVPALQTSAQLNIKDLPSGVYYCVLQASGNRATRPITIIR